MTKPKQRHLSIVYARMTKRKPRHLNIASACLSRPKQPEYISVYVDVNKCKKVPSLRDPSLDDMSSPYLCI